jgi:hypothetical protein
MAKFCPKCGLPLKDDATLMGGRVDDGEGPNRWVLAAGAAGIVAVALTIGFLSSPGRGAAATTVRREPVGRYTAPANPRALGAYASPPRALGGYRFSTPVVSTPRPAARPSGPAFAYNSPVKWAYTPPADILKPKPAPPPDPEAPRQFLTGLPQPKRAQVEVVKSQMAPIPEAPPYQTYREFAPVRTFGPVPGAAVPAQNPLQLAVDQRALPQAPTPPSDGLFPSQLTQGQGNWVWDPVQERYAFRADRLDRNGRFREPRSRR